MVIVKEKNYLVFFILKKIANNTVHSKYTESIWENIIDKVLWIKIYLLRKHLLT